MEINYLNTFITSQAQWGGPAVSLSMSAFTLAALAVSLNSWVTFDRSVSLTTNNEVSPSDSKCKYFHYDYILVGGGTAGIVLATRLANASSNIRVLLLEAGGEPHPFNNIPIFDINMVNQPANTWRYFSVPQENVCQSCDGKRSITTRGKMMGGSSSLNFMLYARGNKKDFDRWAEDVNDTQWNYEKVLPYFKKSENYNGEYSDKPFSDKLHGKGGLLNVVTPNYMPGAEDFLLAAKEKGYAIGDYNDGENQEVFSKIDITTENGRRESTYRAFYQDTGKPWNLCIKTYAQVTKIIFDLSSKNGIPMAVGVVYQRQLEKRTVFATREVILSAGAIETPKLLLLSGVGPKEHLSDMGIPVVKDLPVGKNMQDHLFTIAGPFLKSPSFRGSSTINARNVANFLFRGSGPLASPVGFSGHGFFTSPQAEPRYPDLQVIQISLALSPVVSAVMNKVMAFDSQDMANWLDLESHKDTDARFAYILVGRPKSVGELRLSSRNPEEGPILDPKYLSHPDDRDAILHGFKTVVDLYENTTALNVQLFPKPFPACSKEKFKSDEYYRCYISHISGSFYHHVATCAMGKVVDSRLRVIGIHRLRVVDASVMPRPPIANTQAATILIAEKGADLIIKDLRKYMYRKKRTGKLK